MLYRQGVVVVSFPRVRCRLLYAIHPPRRRLEKMATESLAAAAAGVSKRGLTERRLAWSGVCNTVQYQGASYLLAAVLPRGCVPCAPTGRRLYDGLLFPPTRFPRFWGPSRGVWFRSTWDSRAPV